MDDKTYDAMIDIFFGRGSITWYCDRITGKDASFIKSSLEKEGFEVDLILDESTVQSPVEIVKEIVAHVKGLKGYKYEP